MSSDPREWDLEDTPPPWLCRFVRNEVRPFLLQHQQAVLEAHDRWLTCHRPAWELLPIPTRELSLDERLVLLTAVHNAVWDRGEWIGPNEPVEDEEAEPDEGPSSEEIIEWKLYVPLAVLRDRVLNRLTENDLPDLQRVISEACERLNTEVSPPAVEPGSLTPVTPEADRTAPVVAAQPDAGTPVKGKIPDQTLANILGALGDRELSGRKIGERAGYKYGYVRRILSKMIGIQIEKTSKGYKKRR